MNNMQDNNNQDSIMAQLLASYPMPTKLERGTLIEGTVVNIDKVGAWVSYGGKCDALVPADELSEIQLTCGQKTTFFVLDAPEDEEIPTFSAKRAAGWIDLKKCQTEGTTIKVNVTRIAKNGSGGVAGINVRSGQLNGFVPFSLLGIRGKAIDGLLNCELEVKVTEVNPEERKLIFNHALVLADKAAEIASQRDALFATLKAGQTLSGTVARVVEYGCFVDVGLGLHGLVHKSEISGNAKIPVSELVKVGETVTVKVLKADETSGKRQLSLSIKQPRQEAYLANIKAGEILTGKVARQVAFGWFVELSADNSVDGLLHKSQVSNAVRSGRKQINLGDTVAVRVVEVEPAVGRIGLTMRDVPQAIDSPALSVPAPAAPVLG